MPLTTVGSSRNAMTFIGPSQREQTMTSTANTRLSNAAQSRRYADRVGDGFDDGSVAVVADAGAGVGGAGATPLRLGPRLRGRRGGYLEGWPLAANP
jgi:hypothetical protein